MFRPTCESCGSEKIKIVALDVFGHIRAEWCSPWCKKVRDYYNENCQHPGLRYVGKRDGRLTKNR